MRFGWGGDLGLILRALFGFLLGLLIILIFWILSWFYGPELILIDVFVVDCVKSVLICAFLVIKTLWLTN